MQTYAQSQYKKVDIATADQGRLVVLLYDGAVNFIYRAKRCVHTGDIEGKCNNLNRAYEIIQELNFSLNVKAGGEIAFNLRRLYLFMLRHLIQAKIERDGSTKMEQVISMLSRLAEAWREITAKKQKDQLNAQPEHPRLPQSITV